jgi:hypothetical protein
MVTRFLFLKVLTLQVIGLENEAVRDHDGMVAIITRHLHKLERFLTKPGAFRQRPWVVVVTESNLGLVTYLPRLDCT